MRTSLGLGTLVGVVALRPSIWVEAIRLFLAARRRRSLSPSAAYVTWRASTAYGSARHFDDRDLIDFLAWRKQMRLLREWERVE